EVPVGTPACYIAGDMNSWAFTAMTKVDDTHYTITFDNVHKAMGYKYACGEGWDYEEVTADGGQVYNRTWSENDVVAAWKSMGEGSVAGVAAADVKVYGANGVLCVRAAEEVVLNVYNAQGMLVKALVVEGAADINLAAGMYIVNGTKVLVY
ncbi:MAG: T9SS type A sorting domain-containing protein, partial [Bacteroidaceae bacterium]|nr:T9SS type A sorting domain-containing protein [Bacteroidaceae bacterium]